MPKILGIDLGTSNSVMAIWDSREPRVVVNAEGARLTPSVVAFGAGEQVMVGHVARRQSVVNAGSTISSVKRFMGRRFDEVIGEASLVPYNVVEGENGEALIEVGGDRHLPQEISAWVLRSLKESAEAFLGEPVHDAVITVPAYFNDAQRNATKQAGTLAGLNVRRIINEPTAAALAYGLDREVDRTIAVYDFGGGTFDISILAVGDNLIEVVATHGDTHLGGDDIDGRLVSWLLSEFETRSGQDVSRDVTALQRLREAAERAKIDLSVAAVTDVSLPFLGSGSGGPHHLQVQVTRELLERLMADLVDRTLASCAEALRSSGKDARDIDEVVLVGGSSRIPLVQRRVAAFFGREPRRTLNPDEAVALGAAIQSAALSGDIKGLVLLDVTSHALGVETFDGQTAILIERNTTIPASATRTFSTAADGQTSVEVHVVQGEARLARENHSLGCFELGGVNPAPAGVPMIDVTLEIDVNGIVGVRATDRASGQSHAITVNVRHGTGLGSATGDKLPPGTHRGTLH